MHYRRCSKDGSAWYTFGLALLICVPVLRAQGDPKARFRGAAKADPIRITNVAYEQAADGEGIISFDLAWDHSWRAAWELDESQHGGKGRLTPENWDAAWVFIKFRAPGRNNWEHATLSPKTGDHVAPEGSMVDVGLSDYPSTRHGAGGKRALGAFVHRAAAGSGANNWKGVALRWLHGVDGVSSVGKVVTPAQRKPGAKQPKESPKAEPDLDEFDMGEDDDDLGLGDVIEKADAAGQAAAEQKHRAKATDIRVYAIRMVYVPECAFWAGDGTTNGIAGQFAAGDSGEPFRVESEAALTLGGNDRKNLGNHDNLLATDDFSSSLTRALPADFPKGFAAFYCMMHEITRGEMVAFLNTLSPGQQAALEDFFGAGSNGFKLTGSGALAKYETDAPHVVCDGLAWREALAFSAWSGLRPMTELEFEKACRGPLKPAPHEYAWGTAGMVGAGGGKGQYELKNAGASGETVVWSGENGPDSERGNVGWVGNLLSDPKRGGSAANTANRPLRAGIFATPDSDRVHAGASYWGILDLTGNVGENTVAVGHPIGRQFNGAHGNGRVGDLSKWNDFGGCFDDANRPDILAGLPGWWMLGKGMIWRGAPQYTQVMRVSDRGSGTYILLGTSRPNFSGFRAVRSVSAGRSPATATGDELQDMFNGPLRIANVTVTPRDRKTAEIKFDIGWDESWRNATNHDAAWVFFKAKTAGAANWAHVKLAADMTANPTGYGQAGGTPLEFLVPAGPDGFTGVLLQRAKPGKGPVSAKGVTVVMNLTPTLTPDSRSLTPEIRGFGIEMVYVPEGPFYLGSGGTEANRFYRYTDGSQDTQPYRVMNVGPTPTGPQQGRLWATGVQPDGADAGELPVAFPNGFHAFYCMKSQLKQGQFATFLGMQSKIRSLYHAGRPGNCLPLAKVATAFLRGVPWAEGAAFGAWTGLRPMTELEFEKAWRGPREPVPDEIGPGYWGIRDLSSGGLAQRMVSVGHPNGRGFAGTHGLGSASLPKDWPQGRQPGITMRGVGSTIKPDHYYHGIGRMRPSVRSRAGSDSEMDGWRGVRTAPLPAPPPVAAEKKTGGRFKLELDPVPEIGDLDIAIFNISGRFHNAGDKAVPVELDSPLPDACFLGGAASRAFTASPGADTEFKIPMVMTRRTVRAVRRTQSCPIRIRKRGGDILAEATAKLVLSDPLQEKTSVIGTSDGGKVKLRLGNSTGKPRALKLEMQPPPGLAFAETGRRIDIPAGKQVSAEFPASRRNASLVEGFYNIPYRLVPENGTAQAGVVTAELRLQSRWWAQLRKIQIGPAPGGIDDDMSIGDDGPEMDGLIEGLGPKERSSEEKSWDISPTAVFKAKSRPGGWRSVVHGAAFRQSQLKLPAKTRTLVSAATRVIASAGREAIIKVGLETDNWGWLDHNIMRTPLAPWPGFYPPAMRIWINNELVRDSRPGAKSSAPKPIALKKGANTLLMQFEAQVDGKGQRPNVFLLFYDAKDHAPITDLSFDMEVKP